MKKEFKLSIPNGTSTLDFVGERLLPFEQLNLILKLISIIAKGSHVNPQQVEQVLHNVFQTGEAVPNVENTSANINSFALLFDAIKGALATLTDQDRDWLLFELLKNVKIDCGQGYIVAATVEELNNRLVSFTPLLKLITELAKVNLGFLDNEQK